MASWDDVARIALELPDVVEEPFGHDGGRGWKVANKGFAWERPLRKSDIAALGVRAPSGPILALRTADVEMKEALLASAPDVFFTIPHFDGYAAVLVRLATIRVGPLRAAIVEAWLARAPKRLADAYLRQRPSA